MDSREIAVPLAYFITYTCYGTWLHGEKDSSVDPQHNTPGTSFLIYNPARYIDAKKRMLEPSYNLDESRRIVVLRAIREVCDYRKWTLLAAHVRSNHIHLVVHAIVSPEYIMNSIKSYSSRYLNEAKCDGIRKQRWTRHGSTQYLWTEEEVEATIQYVIHEQGKPMAVFENYNRAITEPRL